MVELGISLVTAIVVLLTVLLRLYISPRREEIEKRKRKEVMDKAIRDDDTDTISRLMSESYDRLQSKGSDSPK